MKYLVVYFDRYDTHMSTHHTTEADSPKDAIINTYKYPVDDGFKKYVDDMLTTTSPEFSSIAEEESDILVFTL